MHKLIRHTFNNYKILNPKNRGFINTRLGISHSLMLGLLIGMPIFIVGFLAIKTLYLEYKDLENTREKASLHFLQEVDNNIQHTINITTEELLSDVKKAINSNPIDAPRKMVFDGEIGFIAVYKDKQRIFPPEDTNHMMLPEKVMVSLLNGLLSTALPQIKNGNTFQTLTSIAPNSSLQSIFYCQSLASGYDTCLLSKPEELTQQLQHVINQYQTSHPQWNLSITGPYGEYIGYPQTRPIDDPNYHHSLSFPLQEWQLHGQLLNNSTSALRWSFIVFIIVISLLLSWVSLVLFFYRQQQIKLKKNIARSELAAKLSHELHTPLANLALYADLLKRRADDVNDVNKYADIIQSETDRLSRVSNIAIAVAQGEEESVKQELGHPDTIIGTLLSRFSAFLAKRQCDVIFTGDVSHALLFDRMALESIVLQLLDNASKYGGKGNIYLTTSLQQDTLYITVQDDGSGIPDDEQELIFKANYRGKHRDKRGFGLGLAAVRHLARLNGGDIHVENTDPGAKFIVSLKVKQP